MSIYTNWDPLEEVIVGNCNTEVPSHWRISENVKNLLNQILKETKEDLDNLSKLFKNLGISVHRPKVYEFPLNIVLPNFSVVMAANPIVPRDQYFAYGNTIYQSYTSMPDRYFDSLHYYEIFKDFYDRGYNWLSQPSPILQNFGMNYKWYVDGPRIYSEDFKEKILWHTATIFKCGDSFIVNSDGPGTQLGLDWMKRNCNAKFINNDKTISNNWGHIDHGFYMIDDDTVICLDEQWVPSVLKNKNIIELKGLYEPFNYQKYIETTHKISDRMSLEWLETWFLEWRGYAQKVAFEANVLVVDRNNIIFSTDQPEVFEKLKKLKINCHVVKQRHGLFWEAGTHCLTLDISRKGVNRSVIQSTI